MKTLKTLLIILTFTMFFSCGVKKNSLIHNIEFKEKVEFLLNEGYSLKASQHIAKVELNIIPEDDFYTMLKED